MLDISAGWGDRMVAAIATDLECYHGFDPNTALQPGHDQLREAFVEPGDRNRFQVTYSGFEGATLAPGTYDLVLTSPPFFNFEIYTSLPGQSVDTYPTLDAWLTG